MTTLERPALFDIETFTDRRGTFSPLILYPFVPHQVSLVSSKYGVIRGLHGQNYPHQQRKLLIVVSGIIKDIIYDPVEQKTHEFELKEKQAIFIPKHFLHGYSVLSDKSEVLYLVDSPYRADQETGIHPLDKTLNLNWGVSVPILSDKDQLLPSLSEWQYLPEAK